MLALLFEVDVINPSQQSLGANFMSYEEFKTEYTMVFKKMMSYKPSEVGAQVYAKKMAELSDKYPEFAERCENE